MGGRKNTWWAQCIAVSVVVVMVADGEEVGWQTGVEKSNSNSSSVTTPDHSSMASSFRRGKLNSRNICAYGSSLSSYGAPKIPGSSVGRGGGYRWKFCESPV